MDQGRIGQSDAEFQSARHGRGCLDGEASRATKLAVPTAGNAGGALAAYAARAGLERIFHAPDTPRANVIECRQLGAHVTLNGRLDHRLRRGDCPAQSGRRLVRHVHAEGTVSARGKKTIGYELAEQFGLGLPDVIVYPTGGGTGLIGMWKAFDEMEPLS